MLEFRQMIIAPVTLEGRFVRLEPLSMSHLGDLTEVAFEPEMWRWMLSEVATSDDVVQFIQSARAEQAQGVSLPFATVDVATGRAIGSTRYLNISPANKRLEIGSTWIGAGWRRTAANTEAKLLMLRHAFEALGALRVEFKTDELNTRSRTAILRIGAKFEGIFRKHMTMPNGRVRNSAYYSIVDDEWPAVKTLLEEKLLAG
jgi:RimJ/RimL family protein N-acetyltransferase